MATPTKREATIENLYHISENGKAEIINGELVRMPPTGGGPGRSGGKIYISLDQYERTTRLGFAFPDNVGFIVNTTHHRSFSPDAAFYIGQYKGGGRFLEGAPVFAVEVRSENDYGKAAEQEMKQKRMDYFEAGTLVVWDVDVLRTKEVRVYRHTDPEQPTIYKRGDLAEAEPALPNWTIPVDDIMEVS